MEKENFINKTNCEFAIVSKEISPEIITRELNIIPDRFFKKGEQTISKTSGSVITKQHNLWAIKSATTKNDEESISHHINNLMLIIFPKKELFLKYKKDLKCELSFWIWIETSNAGFGLDLNEEEMSFLNDFSNRLHISFISNESLA
jgi:hypothetical protein